MKRFRAYGLTLLEGEAESEQEFWDKAMKTAPMMWRQPVIDKIVEIDSNGKMVGPQELPEEHDG